MHVSFNSIAKITFHQIKFHPETKLARYVIMHKDVIYLLANKTHLQPHIDRIFISLSQKIKIAGIKV